MLRIIGVTLFSALAGMTARAQDATPGMCPVGTYSIPGAVQQCVDRCPSPLLGYKGACVQMCPTGLLIDPATATCVTTCPAGSSPMSNGVCTQGQMCPPGTVPYNGACVSMGFICQMKIPGSIFNGQECVCPSDSWMNRNRNTTSLNVESVCVPLSTSGATGTPVNCESYIANTVYNPQTMECQCAERFPVIIRNPLDAALPFSCAPPGTASDIRPCVLPMYFSFPEGRCVNMTMSAPGGQLTASASPSLSVRPSQSSPTATMTQRYPQESSPSMTAKPTDRTNSGDVSASMTAKPSQRTNPDDTQKPSESMTAKPTDRTNSGDVSASMTAKPSQRTNPDDTQKPSESMTAKPSQRTNPDDTQKPSESMTAKPSQRTNPDDNQKPSASMTAKPSQRPLDFTAKPTRRPDSIWAVDATRPPLPSRPPAPSYSQRPLAMSAKPTPWRPRDPLPSDMPLPPYIQSSVKFPGANATKMAQPDVIQDIQASLACTLNLPLDNIRIQNVTVRRTGDVPRVIDVSMIPQLRNNGSVACLRPVAAAAPRLLRGSRALQAAESSVDVDYYIIDPSVDVLALSSAEFSNVLANSASMTEVAASVGSSGVTAVATESNNAPAPAPAPATSDNRIQIGPVAGGVVGGIALCVAAFTAYKLATRGRRQPVRGRTISHSRVILVDNTNPLQFTGVGASSSRLTPYAPTQSRPGSRV